MPAAVAAEQPPPAPPRRAAPSALPEVLFQALTRSAGLFILTLVAGLVGVLAWQAWPVLSRAGHYELFTSAQWVPKPPDLGEPTFGSLAFIWGTVVTSVIAMLIAVPLGVASAAFLSEIAPAWVRRVGAFLVELLAAIPSVVYGFWGLFFLAPVVQDLFTAVGGPNTGGNGILSAGLILSIMILPFITAISFDVCQAVPRSQREGALALGATRWQTIWGVVLPYARPGIVAASFLALGRALGETMAVTMVIGNKAVIDLSPFAYGDSIASKIANSLNEADDPTVRSALIALGLILLLVTATFNVLARLLLARLTRTPAVSYVAAPPAGLLPDTAASLELPPPPADTGPVRSHARGWNRVMTGVLAGGFVLTVVPLFLILGYITVRGAASLDLTLFTEEARPELTDEEYDQYKAHRRGEAPPPTDAIGRPIRRGGLMHAMLGSLIIVGLATVLAVPLGLLAAVYLSEARRSRTAASIRFVTELLGGVPAIVIGIFVYAILVVPTYGLGEPLGFSGYAGAAALAVMMIPIVVRSAEESMRLVPDSLRHASYALGANRMQTVLRVTLPAAMSAIVTGVFLAVARVAGETAPLLLTAGQWDYLQLDPSRDMPFLTGYIYNYSRHPMQDRQDQAWAAALVLLAFVMLVNVGIRLLAGKRQVAASRAD
jgi:phosphate transport system permease protein